MAISANYDPVSQSVSESVSQSVSDDPRYRAAFAAKNYNIQLILSPMFASVIIFFFPESMVHCG